MVEMEVNKEFTLKGLVSEKVIMNLSSEMRCLISKTFGESVTDGFSQ